MFFEIKKRLGKKLSQIEKPDDLQSIANHPVFFVFMTPSMMEITKKRPSANSWCDDLAALHLAKSLPFYGQIPEIDVLSGCSSWCTDQAGDAQHCI